MSLSPHLSGVHLTLTARIVAVSVRDRTVSLILVSAAFIAWAIVAIVFTTVSPVGNAGAQLLGALLLGIAVGLTVWPLLWSPRHHGDEATGSGSLFVAGRRSGLVGLVITILVILRALDAVAIPVLLFLVIAAVLIELALTLRR